MIINGFGAIRPAIFDCDKGIAQLRRIARSATTMSQRTYLVKIYRKFDMASRRAN
jgi:hypothetical protein